jgi:hypothetical protein
MNVETRACRYDEMYDADTPHAQSDEPEVLEYILELPPGEHVLTWVFHKVVVMATVCAGQIRSN